MGSDIDKVLARAKILREYHNYITSGPIEKLTLPLAVPTASGHYSITIKPPGSKSLSNRAVLLAALTRGVSTIHGALTDADDAQRMLTAITQLGARASGNSEELTIHGVGGRWNPGPGDVTLHLENAGTATRFLAGAALLSPVPIIIDGNARMRERPIAELGELLTRLGCDVEYLDGGHCAPLRITPPPDLHSIPRTIEVGTTHSSQFVSALLLVAPWLPHGLTIRFTGEPTSVSYIRMTCGQLARLGASVQESADARIIRVRGNISQDMPGCGLQPFDHTIEPDASGATYFWAAGAVVPGSSCCVQGLDDDSLQGDSDFPQLLARMGCELFSSRGGNNPHIGVRAPQTLRPILADMSDMPDAAMSLASVAVFAGGVSILRGLRTLRVKETDRIAAMQTEFAKIGVRIATDVAGDPDALTITPPPGGVDCSPSVAPVYFDTYDDHRMAMSLAIVALRRPNVYINNPACVRKTYAKFWNDWETIYNSQK